MNEVMTSPSQHYLGKRRGSDEDFSNEADHSFHFNKRTWPLLCANESNEPNSMAVERTPYDEASTKRVRGPTNYSSNSSNGFSIVRNCSFSAEQMQKYGTDLMASMKAEHSYTLNYKDEQIRQLVAENIRLKDESRKSDTASEENKVLKRAVSIQENRLNQLTYQHQQLQQLTGAAAERIEQLENANRELLAHIRNLESDKASNYFHQGFPPAPPHGF